MALGELPVEETGTITSLRVLPATAEGANYEICLSTEGALRGTKFTTNWTYIQVVRNDGSIYGGGDGVCTTECGQVLYLKGSGSAVGSDENGNIPFRVINHYHTSSDKFADLNGAALVGEYDVKPDGTTVMKLWHWK
jgi:hypothetical protein